MFRKIFILVLSLTIIFSNMVYAEEAISGEDIPIKDEFSEFIIEDEAQEDDVPISIEDLGLPTYMTAEIVDSDIVLNWTNYTNIWEGLRALPYGYKLGYQIDFKVGRGDWASDNSNIVLPSGEVEMNSYGKSYAIFNPKEEGLSYEKIDIDIHNYSIRLRYVYTYIENGEERTLYGRFSSPINLGLQQYYEHASNWALEELDKAVRYGFITEKIKSDMTINITREEFCELVMKLYYELSDKSASYSANPFRDVENSEVLKAAELGIVGGVGDGKFAPDNPVTRQEIAVMLKRVLALINPSLDYYSFAKIDYADKNETSSWAINEVGFTIDNGIIQGNSEGKVNPLGHSTREQAVIMILRTYEKFRKVGEGFVSK